MKISLNWIRDYIELDKPLEKIEEALTLIGFEVEGVEHHGLPQLDKCVIGKITSREQHPDADRLGVCMVDVGGEELQQIVCGATNYVVGDMVPAALPGCVLPGNFKIKKSKLRGVASNGMLCSAKELGQGEDHAGLMILTEHPEAQVGRPINEVLTDSDIVIDVEVTPNRPDCLSHVGLARELAAYFDLELKYPSVIAGAEDPSLGESISLLGGVDVQAPQRCPYYSAYSIRDVKIGPSPDWLKKRIEAIGLRPVNNVVDVTNYVLMELGQPLHAFDRKKIQGENLIIRQAKDGEEITTLDEKNHKLPGHALVIADADRPLVIAGVMGSLDAEVDDSTVDIVLEAAYFEPTGIRKTARQLTISTDSSYRYERGVDPNGTQFAALRAIDLILEVAGGQVSGFPLISGNIPEIVQEIPLQPSFVRERLGFGPEDGVISETLQRLELGIEEDTPAGGELTWNVSVPTFRRDLERPIDLVEEFLRIYGTDKIPEQPVRATAPFQKDHPMAVFVGKSTDFLIGQQFSEALHYSLRGGEEVKTWVGHANAEDLSLANPLTTDQSHLRPTLLPGLLDALKLNISRGTGARKLFEVGRVFREDQGRIWEAIAVTFVVYSDPKDPFWKERTPFDFYSAKSLLDHLVRLSGINASKEIYEPIKNSGSWMDGQAAGMGNFIEDGWQAKAGLVDLRRAKEWDIEGFVYAGSFILKPALLEDTAKTPRFKQMSAFPAATKDLALVVKKEALAETVRRDLLKIAKTTTDGSFVIESVEVFDVYEGSGLPEDSKSLAFTISFRAPDRTLSDKQLGTAFDKIQKLVADKTDYSVRG
ncbi:MAG: phenylalanine--tRNA ligase subunit beta [Opitutales bacterium]